MRDLSYHRQGTDSWFISHVAFDVGANNLRNKVGSLCITKDPMINRIREDFDDSMLRMAIMSELTDS